MYVDMELDSRYILPSSAQKTLARTRDISVGVGIKGQLFIHQCFGHSVCASVMELRKNEKCVLYRAGEYMA